VLVAAAGTAPASSLASKSICNNGSVALVASASVCAYATEKAFASAAAAVGVDKTADGVGNGVAPAFKAPGLDEEEDMAVQN